MRFTAMRPYWGATKKACWADQYETSPMYGSRKDDQYGAPPMDGSKDDQVRVPAAVAATTAVVKGPATVATVPARVPTTGPAATSSKGLGAPAVRPVGALASAVEKGRHVGGWGPCGGSGARGYDGTCNTLTGGGGGSLNGGEGCSQGVRSDGGGIIDIEQF
jgi:hypothetical protein